MSEFKAGLIERLAAMTELYNRVGKEAISRFITIQPRVEVAFGDPKALRSGGPKRAR